MESRPGLGGPARGEHTPRYGASQARALDSEFDCYNGCGPPRQARRAASPTIHPRLDGLRRRRRVGVLRNCASDEPTDHTPNDCTDQPGTEDWPSAVVRPAVGRTQAACHSDAEDSGHAGANGQSFPPVVTRIAKNADVALRRRNRPQHLRHRGWRRTDHVPRDRFGLRRKRPSPGRKCQHEPHRPPGIHARRPCSGGLLYCAKGHECLQLPTGEANRILARLCKPQDPGEAFLNNGPRNHRGRPV